MKDHVISILKLKNWSLESNRSETHQESVSVKGAIWFFHGHHRTKYHRILWFLSMSMLMFVLVSRHHSYLNIRWLFWLLWLFFSTLFNLAQKFTQTKNTFQFYQFTVHFDGKRCAICSGWARVRTYRYGM